MLTLMLMYMNILRERCKSFKKTFGTLEVIWSVTFNLNSCYIHYISLTALI